MSALYDGIECTLEDEMEEIEPLNSLDLASLFLDAASIESHRFTGSLIGDDDEKSYDEDDSETIIWLTPRPTPRKQGPEEPNDGFNLDGPPSPTGSSSSSSSEDSARNDTHCDNTEPVNSEAHRALDLSEDEDDEEEWVDIEDEEEIENEMDGDSNGDNNCDEAGSVLSRLFSHEHLLGSEYVYPDKAYRADSYGTNLPVPDIVYGVRRRSDSYEAAMSLYLRWVDLAVAGCDDEAERVLREIRSAVVDAMDECLADGPKTDWPLGRARAALIGQLIRLELMSEDYVSDFILDMHFGPHMEGEMHILHALIRYAGPRSTTEDNLDAIDTVAVFCLEHPELATLGWIFSNVQEDIRAYTIRQRIGAENDCRYSRKQLEGMLRECLEGDESDELQSLLDLVLDQRDKRILAQIVQLQNETKRSKFQLRYTEKRRTKWSAECA